MGIVAGVFRLILSGTFAVAAIAKFANLERSRKTIQDFGLPGWFSDPAGMLLPITEIVVAALLLPVQTARFGVIGSIILLLAFSVAIGINLSLGRKPDCNCFGQVHSEPIGWSTLARNCLLLCGASFILLSRHNVAPISLVNWTKGLFLPQLMLLILAVFALLVTVCGSWVAFHLLRQNGLLLLRMDALEIQLGKDTPETQSKAVPGLRVGSPAPYFELPGLDGNKVITLHTLLAEQRPVVLIFSDPDCGPCLALLPNAARWEREYANLLTFALVSRGSEISNRIKVANHSLRHILLQKDREVAAAYKANGTPAAILIGSDGRVAGGLAMGSQAIEELVATAATPTGRDVLPLSGSDKISSNTHSDNVGLKVGAPAPPLKLADLNGKIVDLMDFVQYETILLFWNPSCGFCTKMLADLRRWEEQHQAEAPKMLVVSSGTEGENRAIGLRSPVLSDQNFVVGMAFHVRGTPSAVRLDAKGNIASEVATGADAILALANG